VRPNSQNANIHTAICGKNPRLYPVGGFVQIKAFSKINLILEVLERRPDGYHNLRSVMQSLALHDTLTIKPHTPAKGTPPLRLTCDNPSLPTDEGNLVFRAAQYMAEAYAISQPLSIHIEKRIPVAAGLGGGSSDCAAALVGINRCFGLGLDRDALREAGLRFGADVPFCITGGTMLAQGTGEILTELPPHPDCWIVLACLPIPVSTGEIFRQVDAKAQPDDGPESTPAPGVGPMGEALKKGDIPGIAKEFFNALAPVTTRMHPEIDGLIAQLRELGALGAAMSGSGPSVFGYFENKAAASAAEHILKKTIKSVFLTRPERMRLP